jgi:TetR/AcrR family transcriptional repressor of nem operon
MKQVQATRERLIEAAHRLALLKGFDRTSVNEILDAAGVKKGAFYHHFADKESLGMAVLVADRDSFMAMLDESLAGPDPMEALDRFFAAALRKHADAGFIGGCLWGNTAIEMSDTHPAFAAAAADVFAEWQSRIAGAIEAGQSRGQIRSDVPAARLARLVVAAVEGGIMTSRLAKQDEPMRSCITSLRTLLRNVIDGAASACPPAGSPGNPESDRPREADSARVRSIVAETKTDTAERQRR